ncbi:MAG: serine phosphatase RsbU (regulator of sigma subunit) [Arenicella sp.]|jgi:serine phosphatase RsbU (regulator of sigma subunit)
MKMKSLLLLLLLLFSSSFFAFGGIELDSLQNALSNAEGGKRIDILLKMAFIQHRDNSYNSLQLSKEAIIQASKIGDETRLAHACISAGTILRNTGASEKALTQFFRALNLGSKLENPEIMANAYHKISVTYLLAKDFENALKYGKEEEGIWREIKNDYGLASALNSVGLTYLNLDRVEEAESYLGQSIDIARKIGNDELTYKPLLNMGDLFLTLKKPDRALEYLEQSMKISKESNNSYGLAVNLLKKSEALFMDKDYVQAITTAKEAKLRAEQMNSLALVRNSYQLLADIYEEEGVYEDALHYNKLYISSEDSMMSEITKREIAQLSTRYDLEEKEREIQRMTKEASYKSTQTALWAFGAVLLSILAVVVINRRNIKKRAESEILNKNDEIVKQNSLLIEQQEELLVQNKELGKMENYAKLIQETILFSNPSFLNIFTDFFMHSSPKREISGDFYWFANKSDSVVIAVGDCTGHNIEGAFNTMIANSLLTQIVNENELRTPADILSELHKKLEKFAKPHKDFPEGFQPNIKLGICQINVNSKRIMYAGARIPFYLIQNGKLHVVEADKSAVITSENLTFQNQILQLAKGDKFLMMTDGLAKQQNQNSEALGESKILETLTANANNGLPKIKETLLSELTDWQTDTEQTDDTLVFGLQI